MLQKLMYGMLCQIYELEIKASMASFLNTAESVKIELVPTTSSVPETTFKSKVVFDEIRTRLEKVESAFLCVLTLNNFFSIKKVNIHQFYVFRSVFMGKPADTLSEIGVRLSDCVLYL